MSIGLAARAKIPVFHHACHRSSAVTEAGYYAQQALFQEVWLTPKPGLVDRISPGSHHDMNFDTFIKSITALTPWLDHFYHLGLTQYALPAAPFFLRLKVLGMQSEQAMWTATHGINTHKGGIFAFSLLLSALGRLHGIGQKVTVEAVCHEVCLLCHGLVERELLHNNQSSTLGEQIFQRYGFAGARGEAATGYPLVRQMALPILQQQLNQGESEADGLSQTLLYLIAHNQDTNLIARGGLTGLRYAQRAAQRVIDAGGVTTQRGREKYALLDSHFIRKNLSPGGSADLLAVTRFLAYLS